MIDLRKQLEAECNKYAKRTLKGWLREAYWEWTGSSVMLGEMLGITESASLYMLKSYGIGVRGRGGVCYTSKPAKKQLEKDYNTEGMTVRQIGQKYSVSHQTVCNWLDSDGIVMRGNHRRKNTTFS